MAASTVCISGIDSWDNARLKVAVVKGVIVTDPNGHDMTTRKDRVMFGPNCLLLLSSVYTQLLLFPTLMISDYVLKHLETVR